jgi:hypothetical protein
MADNTLYIAAVTQSVRNRMKTAGILHEVVLSFRAEVIDGHVAIDCDGRFADAWQNLTREQERLCEFAAVSMRYLDVYGTGTDEEQVLSEYWHRHECFLLAAEWQSEKHSLKGKKKRGHEGPLKRRLRNIIEEGANSIGLSGSAGKRRPLNVRGIRRPIIDIILPNQDRR